MKFNCFSSKSVAAKEGNAAPAKAAAKPAAKPAEKAPAKKEAKAPVKVTNGADFVKAISARRSVYNLGNKLPHSKKEVTQLIEAAIRQCPSAFNVQSSRAVILYGDDHKKVWEIVKDALKKVTAAEQYAASEAKVNNCFLAGAGTVLFYEDANAVKGQQEAFPAYAANFPVWSQQHSAMAQFAVWAALAQEQVGASLQHYNQLIEAQLREAFDVPEHWQLVAQMPFGSIEKPADAKTHLPNEGRFIVFDA